MKSSRLLSILLLLQTRGRMTAAELAGELEVSVRTVYRDAEALAAAGVPLYGDAGHSGGYQLLDGYRTRLTGLAAGEAEALFLTSMPGPAAELGLGQALSTAQLKLRAALPAELRAQADRMRLRFHLDAPGWYAEHEETPHLARIADAVWRGRVVGVRYRRWKAPHEVDRRLAPYGLVLKAGRWYLVAGSAAEQGAPGTSGTSAAPGTPAAPGAPAPAGPPFTYRVDQILAVRETDEECALPDGFELAAHWRRTQAEFHERLYPEEAEVRVSARAAARLTGAQARALAATGTPDPELPGWTRAVLPIESQDHAQARFLELGAEAEVLAPPSLRRRIGAAAAATAARYGTAGAGGAEGGGEPG
ncbi:helix-turn-helix transcriptional regulator [Streptomyces sp. NBC_01264]|uniref:helix-turn-helix transcriptional regulator n=1 Tax=Streptomyces sp. NBC_01264 TaxID=2903804 RepID=UPI00225901A7|nr:WYL domain-containing protein [Streptomyces sp. NBC_01264]MCX4779185.1 WYL domain-containing protein [Streptomyces sp. NBC_01264]